jgi:hypothetical protein
MKTFRQILVEGLKDQINQLEKVTSMYAEENDLSYKERLVFKDFIKWLRTRSKGAKPLKTKIDIRA